MTNENAFYVRKILKLFLKKILVYILYYVEMLSRKKTFQIFLINLNTTIYPHI